MFLNLLDERYNVYSFMEYINKSKYYERNTWNGKVILVLPLFMSFWKDITL